MGDILKVMDAKTEDTALLRKKSAGIYIYITELEAVTMGLNLALKCRLQGIIIKMNSAKMFSTIL